MPSLREEFLKLVLSKEGRPYVWPTAANRYSGKDLPQAVYKDVYDCSGLVTAGIYHVTQGRVDWRGTHNCNKLWACTKPVSPPEVQPGDLVLYGPGTNALAHVMVWVGDGRVYGAGNGDSGCTDPAIAKLRGARVRYRANKDYRPDFRGFRQLPL